MTLGAELGRVGRLDAAGGPAHLAVLIEEAAVGTLTAEYAGLVRQSAFKRAQSPPFKPMRPKSCQKPHVRF